MPDMLMGLYDYPETKSHPAFNVNLRVNFQAGGGDASGFRFVGTEGIISLSVRGSLTLTTKPREVAPGHNASNFSKATSERILRDYREKYPGEKAVWDSAAQGPKDQQWQLPRGYTEQSAHHANFFHAVRTRKGVIEDAVFGLRAAGPALLSNVSHFEKRIVHWDPQSMTVKS